MKILMWCANDDTRLSAARGDRVYIDVVVVSRGGLIDDPLCVRAGHGHRPMVRLHGNLTRAGALNFVNKSVAPDVVAYDSRAVRKPARERAAIQDLSGVGAVSVHKPQAPGIRSLGRLADESDRLSIRRPIWKRFLEFWIVGELHRLGADIEAPDMLSRASYALKDDRSRIWRKAHEVADLIAGRQGARRAEDAS